MQTILLRICLDVAALIVTAILLIRAWHLHNRTIKVILCVEAALVCVLSDSTLFFLQARHPLRSLVPIGWGLTHERLFLPFVDEGRRTSEMIRRILLLLDDDHIEKESSVRQIKRPQQNQ